MAECNNIECIISEISTDVTNYFNNAVFDVSNEAWRQVFAKQVMSIVRSRLRTKSVHKLRSRPKFAVDCPLYPNDDEDGESVNSERDNNDSVETSSADGVESAAETSPFIVNVPSLSQTTELPSTVESSSIETVENKPSEGNKITDVADLSILNDRQILALINGGLIKHRDLEVKLGYDYLRAVHLRRYYLCSNANVVLSNLPYNNYDYSIVNKACCENVIGYVPVPVGFAGPLIVNGEKYMIPLATTEGALIASISRGCKTLTDAGGVLSKVYDDGMTRAPVLKFKTVMEALELKEWLEDPKHFLIVKEIFDSTSNYCRLKDVVVTLYDTMLYVRFAATTGDAMGMNMVSKGVNEVLHMLAKRFSNVEVLSVSGNYCVDKKASAINWINGRGKSVIAEAFIPNAVVHNVLKTTVKNLCTLAEAKLLIGSSMSGTVGGWNAHAANVVAAVFLATGQDAAQVVSSSMCLTSLTETTGGDLHVTCTMRCLEVGTVGGGTILPAQKTCLKMLNCEGSCVECPGNNSKRLAEIICAAVLAGELSLMAALCTDDLVKNHLKYNRSARSLTSTANCVRPVYSAVSELSGTAEESLQQSKKSIRIAYNADKLGESTLECSAIL